ncbi:protein canopy-1-like [Plectropomus leopardus]|uniref:protein canopy-1-like n=1 Tax=Plectropomus leopardus TaxID=160734 RepID=UPI001C4BBE90|nr:protein canopy-1-like [Plectropomus leopardus]
MEKTRRKQEVTSLTPTEPCGECHLKNPRTQDITKQLNVCSPCLPPLSRLCGQVPLARSETHLSELLDGVCNSMSDYALHVDPDTQHKQYKRFAPRSSGATGDFPDLKNFQFTGLEESNPLKFAVSPVPHDLYYALYL